MAKSYRIPRLATVSLILGAGCGDDKSDAIDVSSDRMEKLARSTCEKMFECNPDESEENFGTVKNCASSYEAYWSEYVKAYGSECTDAYLDYYDCISDATCGDENACLEELRRARDVCEVDDSDDD